MLSPAAQPVFASRKTTLFKPPATPLFCGFQSSPLSMVFRITPLSPTAHPSDADTIDMESTLSVRSYSCSYHDAPPLVVWMIVPYNPTAHPLLASENADSVSVFPCGNGVCQFHWLNAVVLNAITSHPRSIFFNIVELLGGDKVNNGIGRTIGDTNPSVSHKGTKLQRVY